MAALSLHPLWESNNYSGRSRRGQNNNGIADHSKADKRRARVASNRRRGRTSRRGRASQCDLSDSGRRAGDTIKPRLLAAGADCSKVLVIDDSDQPLTMLDERLEQAIRLTNARLVVLDPIQSFLGAEVDMHRANEIRPLMKRVSVLAEKYHCAIVLIGHMNKNSTGKSSYRGLGSIDFQAAARSVLIVGRVKNEPEIRVVCHVKSSLAPEGKSIAFRLDKDNGFEWIGEYDISADDLLNGNNRGQKIKEAKEFLLEMLADGAVEQNVILKESENQGIKGKTLWNAKKALGVQSIKPGGHWSWVLPEQ